MTAKEIADVLLKLFEIIAGWPVIVFVMLIVFRRPIGRHLPYLIENLLTNLSQRLSKAEIGGNKLEFFPGAITALKEPIEQGSKEYKDKPEEFSKFVSEQLEKVLEFVATPTTTAQSHSSIEAMSPTTAQPNLSGHSILWVDDKPLSNIYELNLLKGLGASMDTARSTDEGLESLRKRNFDLIVSDIHRIENGQNNQNAGYELLEKLKGIKQKGPLIFYANNVAYLDQSRSQSAYGVADSPRKLMELVVGALQ